MLSQYGSIRVYEFGPEDGEKVLLVHGISTPCITLALIAHGLVKRGCRVMLFVRSLFLRVKQAPPLTRLITINYIGSFWPRLLRRHR